MIDKQEILRDLAEVSINYKYDPFYETIGMLRMYFMKKYKTMPITCNASFFLKKEDEKCDSDYLLIDNAKTEENLINKYKDDIVSYEKTNGDAKILISNDFIYFNELFILKDKKLPQKAIDCIAMTNEEEKKLYWATMSGNGISIKPVEIKEKDNENIYDNYNDDFKEIDEKINNIITTDESSMIILHGVPGTGKSCYIRHLISKNIHSFFYWIDSSMFSQINTSVFLNFLIEAKNGIIILEDCESILKTRENGINPILSSILNISDGMIGDSLNLKFICTFNTDISNIDTAILRKGRLKCKYEFKKLSENKAKKLVSKLGYDESLVKEDMPLCDVYKIMEDNGVHKSTNKIGFN